MVSDEITKSNQVLRATATGGRLISLFIYLNKFDFSRSRPTGSQNTKKKNKSKKSKQNGERGEEKMRNAAGRHESREEEEE